MQACQVTD